MWVFRYSIIRKVYLSSSCQQLCKCLQLSVIVLFSHVCHELATLSLCLESLKVRTCFIQSSTLSKWPQVRKDLFCSCVHECFCVCVLKCKFIIELNCVSVQCVLITTHSWLTHLFSDTHVSCYTTRPPVSLSLHCVLCSHSWILTVD